MLNLSRASYFVRVFQQLMRVSTKWLVHCNIASIVSCSLIGSCEPTSFQWAGRGAAWDRRFPTISITGNAGAITRSADYPFSNFLSWNYNLCLLILIAKVCVGPSVKRGKNWMCADRETTGHTLWVQSKILWVNAIFLCKFDSFPKNVLSTNWPKFPTFSLIITL